MKLIAFIVLILMYPLFLRLIHISDLRVIPLFAPYALGILSLVIMCSGIIEFIMNKLLKKRKARRKEDEEQIRFQAHHDALTQLPNRILFSKKLNAATIDAQQTNSGLAVLLINLDSFKKVNDTLGPDIGDLLLQEAAQRLISCVKPEDTVARMGGDEFTMFLSNLTDTSYAKEVAAAILAALKLPFELNGLPVSVGASIGISMYPYHGEDAQTLMKHADIAMYKAKEDGKNQYVFF
jgi:diguanylate cyclase (GGDEF)-like protein